MGWPIDCIDRVGVCRREREMCRRRKRKERHEMILVETRNIPIIYYIGTYIGIPLGRERGEKGESSL